MELAPSMCPASSFDNLASFIERMKIRMGVSLQDSAETRPSPASPLACGRSGGYRARLCWCSGVGRKWQSRARSVRHRCERMRAQGKRVIFPSSAWAMLDWR